MCQKSILISALKDFEMCGIRCNLDDVCYNVIVIYRSPCGNFERFENSLHNLMEHIYDPKCKHIVCGDFNVDLLQRTERSNTLTNLLLSYNLTPSVLEPTRITRTSETCIDNIFSDSDGEFKLREVGHTPISDHTFQIVDLYGNHQYTQTQTDRSDGYRLFKSANHNKFKELMDRTNWDDILTPGMSTNESYQIFYNVVKTNFDLSYPIIQVERQQSRTGSARRKKTWITKELRMLSSFLREMYLNAKQSNSIFYKKRYRLLKKFYDHQKASLRRTYNDNRLVKSSNPVRESWIIINESTGKNNNPKQIESIHDANGNVTRDKQTICDIFNNYYSALANMSETDEFRSDAPKTKNQIQQSGSCYLYPTTAIEVKEAIGKLCKKSSSGIDEIPGYVLTKAIDSLCQPLSHIINKSFEKGVYPDPLKTSKVVPIFKGKGSKTSPKSYRPVAVQCHFAKIFEYCINQRLTNFLEKNDLLSPHQHGFRGSRSTITALDTALQLILKGLEEKYHVIAIMFDMSRAFDSLRKDILLSKLESMGVRGTAYNWIDSYLSKRDQCVAIQNYKSARQPINNGTPQGSCLSPTLFNCGINDLPTIFEEHSIPVLYADDTNVIICAPSKELLYNRAQTCINIVSDWCLSNAIKLNEEKSMCLEFYPKNKTPTTSPRLICNRKTIKCVYECKFLGVWFDYKLIWRAHIDNLLPKLNSFFFVLRNLRSSVSPGVLKTMYNGLIQSNMTYGIILWGSSSDTSKVFRLQKRIVRHMAHVSNNRTSCRDLFVQLGLLTLTGLYLYHLLIYFKKSYLQNRPRRGDSHGYHTRFKDELDEPFSRLVAGSAHPLQMGAKCYNKLLRIEPNLSGCHSIISFKKRVKQLFITKCYYSIDEFLNDSGN